MTEFKDKYFKLTGNKLHQPEKQRYLLEIECECGNICFKSRGDLRAIRTCGNGCPISAKLRSDSLKGRERPLIEKGLSGMSRIFDMYKRRAKKKLIDFSLTKSEFKKLTSSDCYYCGEPPSMLYRHKQTKTTERERENSEYLYNSLDRIDSSKGYTLENVRPSCKCCNIMKWDHEESFFKDRIEMFYNFYFKNKTNGDCFEEHF